MSEKRNLHLYFHPLASFCWKVLVAFYENEIEFESHLIEQANPEAYEELVRFWPFAKFPVLHDRARDKVVIESSIIIEYLDQHHGGRTKLLPADAEAALETRFQDRFMDMYVHEPMQKIVADKLRPADQKDPLGVTKAKESIEKAYGVIERQMSTRTWASGEAFTLADCAAAPALHYANRLVPIGDRKNTAAYLARLEARPSFKRVLAEAKPYFHLFPG